jgi:hypothetical protein
MCRCPGPAAGIQRTCPHLGRSCVLGRSNCAIQGSLGAPLPPDVGDDFSSGRCSSPTLPPQPRCPGPGQQRWPCLLTLAPRLQVDLRDMAMTSVRYLLMLWSSRITARAFCKPACATQHQEAQACSGQVRHTGSQENIALVNFQTCIRVTRWCFLHEEQLRSCFCAPHVPRAEARAQESSSEWQRDCRGRPVALAERWSSILSCGVTH